jgi:maltooligosyltrehalose trehalohydrolase
MTGHSEGYYLDFQGTPQELISAIRWGFLYQGQWNPRRAMSRGTPGLDVEAPRYVVFLQNHDQVANSPHALRCHQLTSPGRHRALTAVMLLAPATPLLFQGQEFSASSPFLFFADHEPHLQQAVTRGREESMRQFRSRTGEDYTGYFADPCDRSTFERSKLDPSERERNAEAYQLHRDLLRLRRDDKVFAVQDASRIHGAVLADEAFLLRYFGASGDDRLLLVNLGRSLECRPATEPLLVPPEGRRWVLLWSSENPRYGGIGTGEIDERIFYLPGHATVVLRAEGSR